MSAFAKLRAPFKRTNTNDALGTSVAMTEKKPEEENKKDPATATATDEATDDATASNSNDDSHPEELPDQNVQYGVQDVEAVTLTWSRRSLIFVFAKYVLVCPRCPSICASVRANSISLIVSGCSTSSTHSSPRFSPACCLSSRARSNRTRCSMSSTLSQMPCQLLYTSPYPRSWTCGAGLKALPS